MENTLSVLWLSLFWFTKVSLYNDHICNKRDKYLTINAISNMIKRSIVISWRVITNNVIFLCYRTTPTYWNAICNLRATVPSYRYISSIEHTHARTQSRSRKASNKPKPSSASWYHANKILWSILVLLVNLSYFTTHAFLLPREASCMCMRDFITYCPNPLAMTALQPDQWVIGSRYVVL